MRLPRISLLYISLAVTLVLCAGLYATGFELLAKVFGCMAILFVGLIVLSSLFVFGLEQMASWSGYGNIRYKLRYTMMVAQMYADGRGVPRDYVKAANWWRAVAVEHGLADAQLFLGSAYAEGNGVPKDPAEAVRWYRMAAEQGDGTAGIMLGAMYYQGKGVTQDSAEAARWYRLAAEQGEAGAQLILGNMYHRGDGVAQDTAEAAHWYWLAAQRGNSHAEIMLETIARVSFPSGDSSLRNV